MHIEIQNCFSFWGTKSPRLPAQDVPPHFVPGLRPCCCATFPNRVLCACRHPPELQQFLCWNCTNTQPSGLPETQVGTETAQSSARCNDGAAEGIIQLAIGRPYIMHSVASACTTVAHVAPSSCWLIYRHAQNCSSGQASPPLSHLGPH